MAKQKDNTTEQINNQNRLNESLKKQQEILGQIYALESDSLDSYSDRLNLQDQLYSSAKLIATLGAKIDQFSESTSDRARMLVEQYSGQRDLLDEIQSKYGEIVVNSNNIAEDSFEIVDLSKEHNKLAELLLETELAREILGEKEYNKQKDLLDIIKDKLSVMDNINDTQSKANELAKKFLSENTLIGGALGKTFSKIESMAHHFGDHGVIGSILGKKASHLIEHAQSDIKKKVVKAFQESGEAGVTAFSVAKMAAGSFAKYAVPALGILGVLGIFYGIIHAVQHLDEEMAEIAHKFSLNREEADKLHHSAIDVAKEMRLVGINSEEVLNSMKETSNVLNGLSIPTQFAKGNEAVKEMVKDVTVLSQKFELGSDEIQGISNLSVITGKSIGQLVKESVKMGKGLLGTKKSIEVIAKLSPTMALNFKKGGLELLKAAQRAKLLGMELDTVQDFGEGILDFETSLEKEMEARVLTGKNINFDLARQYALNNDIAGLQEEMLNQLGSLNDFEKMNFLQRKATAEAFGMTVDQVANILTAQERLNQLGISQAKMDAIQAKNAEQLAEEAKTTSNEKLKGYLLELAKQKEVETISNRISDAVKKIKETLSATLAPLLEQVHHFLDSAEGAEFIKGTVEGIKTIMYGMVSLAKMFASGISYVNKLFGGTGTAVALIGGLLGTVAAYFVGKALIVNGVKSLVSGLGSASGAASSLAGNMQNVANASNAIGGTGGTGGAGGLVSSLTPFAQNMLAISVGIIAFAGALYISAKAFQEFGKVNWDKAKYGGFVMVGLMAGIGVMAAAAYALVATGADVALKLVALSVVAFAAALIGSAYAFKIMSEINWKGFDGMFTTMAKIVSSFAMLGLASIPIMAGAVAVTVAGAAIGVFAGGMYLLSKAMKTLNDLGDMKAAGENLANGLKELGKIPTLINISALEDSFDELEDALDELDFGDLVAFGDLAKAEMKNAGKNLVEGINSLVGINSNINWSQLETTFDLLEDSLDELNFDDVKAFSELAKTDLSKVGQNINNGLKSLSEVQIDSGVQKTLSGVEKVFDWFEDALSELDYEDIKEFTSASFGELVKFSDSFNQFLQKLMSLPKGTANIIGGFKYYMVLFQEAIDSVSLDSIQKFASTSFEGLKNFAEKFSSFITTMYKSGANAQKVLMSTKYHFHLLNDAIRDLDLDRLQEFATVNTESFRKIASVFQQPQTVNVSGKTTTAVTTAAGAPAGDSEQAKANKKMDRMISLLETLVTGLNQPTVIKIGDKTVETIAVGVERLKQQGTTRTGGRGIDMVPSR